MNHPMLFIKFSIPILSTFLWYTVRTVEVFFVSQARAVFSSIQSIPIPAPISFIQFQLLLFSNFIYKHSIPVPIPRK